jgi:hypothetical protein
MESARRLAIAAGVGAVVIVLAGASDFVLGSFWSTHAMLSALIASLIVLGVTVVVLNEWLERRDRRRWRVLAQYVLFQLVQSARATWTTLVELIMEREIEPGDAKELRVAAAIALEGPGLSSATSALLADPRRRAVLQAAIVALAGHSRGVVLGWASVMVGSGPYTDVFDRHVELQGRLDWISEMLAANEPNAALTLHDAKLARSSVATEHAVALGTDEWLHDQIVATVQLATRLDYESRALGFQLVPMEWWDARTQARLADLSSPGG